MLLFGCRLQQSSAKAGFSPSTTVVVNPSHQQSAMRLLARRWGGEENWKKAAKLMGWDKDSLTEQQMKRKITTIILVKEYTK